MQNGSEALDLGAVFGYRLTVLFPLLICRNAKESTLLLPCFFAANVISIKL